MPGTPRLVEGPKQETILRFKPPEPHDTALWAPDIRNIAFTPLDWLMLPLSGLESICAEHDSGVVPRRSCGMCPFFLHV